MNKSLFLTFVAMVMLVIATPALADSVPETKAAQAVILDMETNAVIFSKDGDVQMAPSSMSKLMTIYIVFQRLKQGNLSLADTFNVSEKAWRMGGSKMFVDVGSAISVNDLLQGVVVQSGNDACIVLAEGLEGSEEAFAHEMNRVAEEIGLKGSHFMNSTGWPDDNHYMTAHDLAVLAQRLIKDFPEYYHYFSETEFTYNGIRQPNRNTLLHRDNSGIDGLKTGHTEAGGYGIVISAERDGRRIVTVVNGLSSEKERLQEAEALLNRGFRDFTNQTVFTRGQSIGDSKVWLGGEYSVPLVLGSSLTLSIPRKDKDNIKVLVSYDSPIAAPVKAGDHVGEIYVAIPGGETRSVPVVAGKDIDALTGFHRIIPAAKELLLNY